MRKQYIKNKWKGLDNYKCLQCRFASLNEETILEHVTKHPPLPEPEVKKPRKVRKKIELIKHIEEQEKGIDTWQ